MKEIKFNKAGAKLWINIDMLGLYFTTYTYQLWASKASDPPILTNPLKSGTNESPHDDNYCVLNDFVPNEPIANHDQRVIDVRFWVKKVNADDGYTLKVTVLQGATYQTAQPLDHDEVSGKVGSLSVKQEFITIKLIEN
jgi:hypothetical protein